MINLKEMSLKDFLNPLKDKTIVSFDFFTEEYGKEHLLTVLNQLERGFNFPDIYTYEIFAISNSYKDILNSFDSIEGSLVELTTPENIPSDKSLSIEFGNRLKIQGIPYAIVNEKGEKYLVIRVGISTFFFFREVQEDDFPYKSGYGFKLSEYQDVLSK